MKAIKHYIENTDCYIIIEKVKTQKEIFGWMEDYIQNLSNDWFISADDECFDIIYTDGTEMCVDSNYNGEKIKKKNIKSMAYHNPETTIIYGDYKVNEWGVVYII